MRDRARVLGSGGPMGGFFLKGGAFVVALMALSWLRVRAVRADEVPAESRHERTQEHLAPHWTQDEFYFFGSGIDRLITV